MAEIVKIPVGMTDINPFIQKVLGAQKALQGSVAKQIQKWQETLEPRFAGDLLKQGVTGGRYATRATVPVDFGQARDERGRFKKGRDIRDVELQLDANITKLVQAAEAQMAKDEARAARVAALKEKEAKKTEEAIIKAAEQDRRHNLSLAEARKRSRQEWLGAISEGQEGILGGAKETQKKARERNQAYVDSHEEWLGLISDGQEGIFKKEEARFERDNKSQAERDKIAKETENKRMARDKKMSHATMGLASASIGLFGQAGFPLLNVAFASMSGMKYAGIGAVFTAIGESGRFVNRLSTSADDAARKIGMVSRRFKDLEATLQGTVAAVGGIGEIAKERAVLEKTDILSGAAGMLGNAIVTQIKSNLTVAGFLSHPGRHPIMAGIIDAFASIQDWPDELRAQRREFLKTSMPFRARFEAPEQVWTRIQQRAASRIPDQTRLALKQLEAIDKQIEAAEKFAAAVERLNEFIPEIPEFVKQGYRGMPGIPYPGKQTVEGLKGMNVELQQGDYLDAVIRGVRMLFNIGSDLGVYK